MSSIKVNCGNIEISNDNKICIIAGPCQLETEQHAMDMAGKIQEITKKFNLGFPMNILNIGGISNVTSTTEYNNLDLEEKIFACDIGPGNCLIDEWMRKNSKKGYDKEGLVARSGKTDKLILNQALDNFTEQSNFEKSLDIKNFDIFFAKGLSLEDGAATITDFTAKLISNGMNFINNKNNSQKSKWLVCGGGRKNKTLIQNLKSLLKKNIFDIDKFNYDGDFIESQAFAYLAIRSYLKKNISFPSTTKVRKPISGGETFKNY